ncbi:DNA-directed RNA polymerase I subunit RPA43-like, partial [Limulus polyphemus]|uniref:DNA-directed RNA polymerase I subunit RPA43-like n=1 Tax=Limulus polyphemus TaxID=6850 RepID=A0ABM1C0Z7_LIMPO
LSPEHVGCVALGCINVSIQLTRCLSPELIPYLRVGQEVFLKVISIDFQRKVLHIGGKITSECIQFMKDIDPHPQVINGDEAVSEDGSSLSHDNTFNVAGVVKKENSLTDCGTKPSTTSLQDSLDTITPTKCLDTNDITKNKSVKKKNKRNKKIKTSPKKSKKSKKNLSKQSSSRKDKTKNLKKRKQNKLTKKRLKKTS